MSASGGDSPVLAGDWEEYNREHVFPKTYTYKCHRCGVVHEHSTSGRRKAYCDPCLAIRRAREKILYYRRIGIPPAFLHSNETKENIRERHARGESASHIARALGLRSRNVVIGLWHRMGLCSPRPKGRQSVETKRQLQRQRRAAKKIAQGLPTRSPTKARAKPVAMPSSLIAPAPLSFKKPIINLDTYLTNKGCKWLNDDGPCGKPMWEHSKTYCEHHAAVSTRRG